VEKSVNAVQCSFLIA